MDALYPFFIAFIIIFLAELGDKTQLLMLSFASKSKVRNIVIGIALGTLLSHGFAIFFGSKLGLLENGNILYILKLITYITFLILGITGFIHRNSDKKTNSENGFIKKISNTSLNYIFVIALCIIIGEIGDKTFLSSIGLGIEYPNYKIALIAGAILGMIMSNSVAILFGKFLESKVPEKYINIVSNIIFIVFGTIGIFML